MTAFICPFVHFRNTFKKSFILYAPIISWGNIPSILYFPPQGVQHLKNLESLILYYNCIPSLDNLKKLCELKSLKELDLRLNPVTKRDKHYRSYLVHTMPNLRKLGKG